MSGGGRCCRKMSFRAWLRACQQTASRHEPLQSARLMGSACAAPRESPVPPHTPCVAEEPIVPAATKNYCRDIDSFSQALMLKTSPDRFDHSPEAPAGCSFDFLEPTCPFLLARQVV